MKVVIINRSDSRGGAAVASYRLFQSLRDAGVDARMLVVHRTIDDPNISLLQPKWRREAAFLYEHAEIFALNGFSRKKLFQASIATCGMNIHSHPWVKEADIVVLGWVNQGTLSLAEIRRIPKPVVWIMHDMWCLTGVCHHAGTCEGFTKKCGHCHLLFDGRFAHDLSSYTFRRKRRLYDRKKIHFVAVSNWLKGKCMESALMRDQEVSVLPNPFDESCFRLRPEKTLDKYRLPSGKRFVIMVAARLDDPIKGLPIAVDALNRLTYVSDLAAIFVGDLRDPHALDGLRLPHYHFTSDITQEGLADLYAISSVLISTSYYETLPLTLIEGMASGCVPVTFGRGGQPDIVDHLSTGYIARYQDPADIAEGIRFALSGAIPPERLRQEAIARFGKDEVAKKYIALFQKLITKS